MTEHFAGAVRAGAEALFGARAIPDDDATARELQAFLGVTADGAFGPVSREALFRRLSNTAAKALADADYQWAAGELGVPIKHMRGVAKVECAGKSFDDQGRPRILFERHYFHRLTGGRWSAQHPAISSAKAGGYGPSAAQFGRLAAACALDPGAAFRSASWGMFQIMGSHAVALGYGSALAMALTMVESERGHLEAFVRFIRVNGLVDELRACRPGNITSCVPFVARYNGPGFARNDYHRKLAEAIR
jgi:hypothetical protein